MKPAMAIGFVVYHAPETLRTRLALCRAAGFRTYVFDNSPDRPYRAIAESNGAVYLTEGRNAGLGVGIGAICRAAYGDAHETVLFFDQDTGFDATTLEFVQRFQSTRPDAAAAYAVIGFNATRLGEQGRDPFSVDDVLLTISSGSLFYLDNARRLGWHNPTYFVDAVDYEFCLRSSLEGFRIGQVRSTPGFDHATEQADETRAVFGRPVRLRRYPASRIKDSVRAGLRVAGTAFVHRNWPYFAALSRLLAGYLFWAIVAHLAPLHRSTGAR